MVGVLAGVLILLTAGISDELIGLEEMIGDQAAAVSAARRFDSQQQELIAWDRAMARSFIDQGRRDLSDTKQQDIQRRIALINEAWTYVIGYYPRNARAVNYYGEYLYDYAGKPEEAIRQWTVALRLDEKLAPAHNNLGVHFSHSGKIRKGLGHLHSAREIDSTNPDYLFNLAQIYLTYFPDVARIRESSLKKVYRDAMEYSRDSARYAPNDYDLLVDYAVNFYAAENFGVEADWVEAAKAWEVARTQASGEGQRFYTWLNEARAWSFAKEWKRAVEALNEALAIRPASKSAGALLDRARDELAGP